MALAAFAHMPHRDLDREELRRLAEELSAREDLWGHLIRHDAVERTYESLVQTDHVEVWVTCWMHDHDTGFHDHDLSAGAVAVIAGQVCEERLALDGPVVSRTFRAGQCFDFGVADIHRVLHAGRTPAVTLHAYSPRLRRMGAYTVEAGGVLRRYSLPAEEELRPLPVVPATAIAAG